MLVVNSLFTVGNTAVFDVICAEDYSLAAYDVIHGKWYLLDWRPSEMTYLFNPMKMRARGWGIG